MPTNCPECGSTIHGEHCPSCGPAGSIAAAHGSGGISFGGGALVSVTSMFTGTGGINLGGAAEVNVVRHWTRLLQASERLYADGNYSPAVIVAATACEVIVDRAMSKGFASRGVPDLDEPFGKLSGNVLIGTNKWTRKVYQTLTGDHAITQHPFWAAYGVLVEHRNAAAHRGVEIAPPEARTDIDAALAFVQHVEQHNALQ